MVVQTQIGVQLTVVNTQAIIKIPSSILNDNTIPETTKNVYASCFEGPIWTAQHRETMGSVLNLWNRDSSVGLVFRRLLMNDLQECCMM